MKGKLLLFIFLGLNLSLFGQKLGWEVNIGSTKKGIITDVVQTMEGDIAVIGNENGYCFFDLLNIVDGKSLLGKPLVVNDEIGSELKSITMAYDGTFILVGHKIEEKQKRQGWLIKIDKNGEILSEKTFGESGNDGFNDVVMMTDETIAIVGYTTKKGYQKAWWVKTDMDGVLIQSESLNSNDSKKIEARAIIQKPDGQLIVSGIAENQDKNESIWVLELNEFGKHTSEGIYHLFDDGLGGKSWEETTDLIFTQEKGIAISGFQGSGILKKNWLAVVNNKDEVVFNQRVNVGEYSGGEEGHTLSQLPDGRIVIGGYTKNYKRGSKTIPRIFIQILKPITFETDTILYLEEINYFETLETICTTNDGQLLIGGRNYKKGKVGAWLGLYQLPTKQKKSVNSNVKIEDIITKTNSQNDVVNINEQAYGVLKLTNLGTNVLHGLKINIEGKRPEGLDIPRKLVVNQLLDKTTKTIGIPIKGGQNLTQGKVFLEIIVQDANDNILATFPWFFHTIQEELPHLEIVSYQFDTKEDKINKGENFNLILEIKNTGKVVAKSTLIELEVQDGITNNYKNVPIKILPDETKTIIIPITVEEVFNGTLVEIFTKVKAEEESTFFQRRFTVELNEQPKTEVYFVDLDWKHQVYPKEKKYVNMGNGQYELNLLVSTNMELDETDIELYVNEELVERSSVSGSKYGEQPVPTQKRNKKKPRQKFPHKRQIFLEKEGKYTVYFKYKNNLLSRSKTSDEIIIDYIPKKPVLYVLAIGPEYGDNDNLEDLKYTANDAKAFIDAFEHKKGIERVFGKPKTTLLIGDDAKSQDIRVKVEEIANKINYSEEKAFFIIFISSHGVVKNDEFIIAAKDYKPLINTTFVKYKEHILKPLEQLKDKGSQFIFIDACRSGQTGGKGNGFSNNDFDKILKQLMETNSLMTFASSGSRQLSWEDDAWQHGAFTKAMLEAFNNETVEVGNGKVNADKDNNSIITISELTKFVQRRVTYIVKEVKGKEQHPVISNEKPLEEPLPFYFLN